MDCVTFHGSAMDFNRVSFWRTSPFPLAHGDRGIRTYNIFTSLFLCIIAWTPIHRTFLSPGVIGYRDLKNAKIVYLSKQDCVDWLISHGKTGFTKASNSLFIISAIEQIYLSTTSSIRESARSAS